MNRTAIAGGRPQSHGGAAGGAQSRRRVNSPFVEPKRYWSYDREHRLFTLEEGRRPAGYVVATPGGKSFDDPGGEHKRIAVMIVDDCDIQRLKQVNVE